MAVVFAAIGAAIGGTVGAFLIMYGTQLATAAYILGTAAYSNAQRSRARRRALAEYNAAQVDRLANVANTTGKRQLVLGRCRVGGDVFFRGSVGAHNEKFVMAVAIAGHEIDAVEQVWFNDQAITLDAGGWVQTAPFARTTRETRTIYSATNMPAPEAPPEAIPGTVMRFDGVPENGENMGIGQTTYQVDVTTSYARVRWMLGTADQTAHPQLVADFPTLWTAEHRARGVAYLVVELFYDETAFPSGVPAVSATVRGARCFDPRTGTTVFTENPAIQARHVLLHPYFGKRSSLSATEDARIIAAANACDVPHNYGAGAVPLYRSAYVCEFGTAARDVLDDLAQAMGGQWAHAAGEFHIRAGVYTAPVMSLTAADLATTTRTEEGSQSSQPVAISTHRARVDKLNSITPVVWDAAQGYQRTPLTPLAPPALAAADGAVLSQEVDMPAVFYGQQAQHIAGISLRDARDPLIISAPFTLRAWPLELFDTVAITMPRYGWTAKPFTVLGRTLNADGRVELTLKETAAAIYQPDATFVPSGYAQNTALPDPWNIAAPVLYPAESGTAHLLLQADGTVVSRVRVSWAPVLDVSVLQAGGLVLEWAPLLGDGLPLAWQALPLINPADGRAYISNAQDGARIAIRARLRNSLALGDWSLLQYHTVVGKTEPPATVQAVTVSGTQVAWTPVADVDLAGYRLRFSYGRDTWWDYAAPLHEGLVTESPYSLERVPAGECTVLVKAVDASGNESAEPAFAVYAFPEQAVANVLLSYAQHPTFTGTITDGSLVAGELEAAALDSFYEPADGPMYLPSADPMYPPSQYAAMGYEFAVLPTEAGTLRVQTTISGAYRIEYATGGADPLYTPTGDPMYSPADEALYGTPSAWQLWPGSLAVDGTTEVRFRITLAAGDVQGVISAITAVLDVPDITESLSAVAIASGGTRLPITKTYHGIKTVALTVHSGGSGTSARIVDKDAALGPLIQVINTSGTAVAGTVDAQIQGY